MARYIDADVLKRKVQKAATEAWKMKLTAKIETTLNQFNDWIDEMPTVQPEATCRGCQYEPRYSLDEPCATCSNNYVNKYRSRNA